MKNKNNRNIIIIECPTNLGLSKLSEAKEPGVGKLPQWLREWGFHSAINPSKVIQIPAPVYGNIIDPVTQVRNSEEIIKFSIAQADIIYSEMHHTNFLLLLGGDCSLLIGSALALKKKGSFGLFYLDGHTDYITPELSHTHGAAGMDLAIVCGLGHKNLSNIMGLCPYLQQEHVYCVGNREHDDDYERPILNSKVHYFPLNQLRRVGIDKIALDFLDMIEIHGLDGFFIHLDVDVLNDLIMPAVDSPQTDGLFYDEIGQILTLLLSSKKAVGMEITILDPDLDPTGKYTVDFIKHIVSSLKSVS